MDRFSALPHEVAHHILSLLSIADSTRVGVLSKTCRAIHLSNPTLNFTEFPSELTRTSMGRSQIINSLDGFFNIHRAFNKIESFFVNWVSRFDHRDSTRGEMKSLTSVEISQILDWVRTAALRCNVEMLNVVCRVNILMPQSPVEVKLVRLDEGSEVELPSCVFVCGSLKYLTLDLNVILKSPCFSPSSSSNLVCLKLLSVTIEDDDGFGKWVSFSCKCLKELSLRAVQGLKNVAIMSSSRELFDILTPRGNFHLNISGEKLERIHIDWPVYSPNTNCLNVFAPNLKYLTWFGNVMNFCSLGELSCLEQVEICYLDKMVSGRTLRTGDLYSEFDKFFWSIRMVKVLVMGQKTAQDLMNEGFLHFLEPFYNVRYLGIRISRDIDDEMIPSIVSLLRAVPNFTTLDIRTSSRGLFFTHGAAAASSFDSGYWQLLELDFINRVKEVTIEITDGSNGIEFAKYVLENSSSLEKMFIICATSQKSSLMEEIGASRVINPIMIGFQAQNIENKVTISTPYAL